jgi:hypothetical protein
MRILAILPFDLTKSVPQVQSQKFRDIVFISGLPAEVCLSFRQAHEILGKHRFSYDIVLSTYTYDEVLSAQDIVPTSTGVYGSACHHVSQILTNNPFATVVLWTGAGSQSIELEPGLRQRVTLFDRNIPSLGGIHGSTETEMQNLRATIADALMEYRLSLTDQDRIAVNCVCSRGPISLTPTGSSFPLPVRLCLNTAFRTLENTIGEFEDLINKKNVSEHEVELFLRSYLDLLRGNRYKSVHWQIHLKREAEGKGDLVPDILLEPVSTSDYWKILDLKRPDVNIARSPGTNRAGFNSRILEALHQLREYREYFENPLYRRQLSDLGITAYKPEISVVIGRDYGGLSVEEVIKAKGDFGQLEVMTYSDLVNQLRNNMMWIAEGIGSANWRQFGSTA